MVHFQEGSYIHGNCRLLLSSKKDLQLVPACAHRKKGSSSLFRPAHTTARILFSLRTCAHNSKVRTCTHIQQGPRHCAHSYRPSTKPQNYSTQLFSFLLDHKLIFLLLSLPFLSHPVNIFIECLLGHLYLQKPLTYAVG